MESIAKQGDTPVKVSVIIPVYNASDCIERCLRAVLEQSLSDIEVLCVDDCSSDDSVELIRAIASEDERIHLIRHAYNQGPGAARNTAIDQAKGEFLTFLDTDDCFGGERYLERLYTAAVDNNMKVSAANFVNEHSSGFIEDDFPEDGFYWAYTLREEGPTSFESYQFDYGFHRFMFSRELFEHGKNRFPLLRFFEDPVFIVNILWDAREFYACPDQAYCYHCEYRKERWTTEKALDYMEGVRRNLRFSRDRSLARLHWITACHFDWEFSRVGVGANANLDLRALERKLRLVEAELDEHLRLLGGNGEQNTGFVARLYLESAMDANLKQQLAEKLKYSLLTSKLWYQLKPFVKPRD